MAEQRGEIVIVDDEVNVRRVLGAMLRRDGFEVREAADGDQAMELVAEGLPDAIITDLRMPRLDGMALLKRLLGSYPDLPVIIITAHGTVDTAVEALKAGAFDYITKPFEQAEMRAVVRKAVDHRALARRDARPVQLPASAGWGAKLGMIGEGPEMRAVFEIIEKVASSPTTVLITGESGTGKELVAKALHRHGDRAAKAFIKINCAAIPKDLMESELFGYEKGAFTGAVNSKPGRFELADQGTLFLDEIGEIPVEMQVKLLRVLQEGEFERVGGLQSLRVDVRLIAATNRELEAEVAAARFREDLYYRLNVVRVTMPALRDRPADIPQLVAHFVEKFNARLGKAIAGVDEAAVTALRAYPWPGNIRELENVMERTILFAEGDQLRLADLPPEIRRAAPAAEPSAGAAPAPSQSLDLEELARGAAGAPGGMKQIVRDATVRLERDLIVRALEETGGNVTHAAKKLGISRKSLQTKMKELGLREGE
jgi:two-component system response regulator AtoC